MNGQTVVPKKKSTLSGFLFLSLVLTLILLIVFLMPLEPSDFWPYLRIGSEIMRTGNIPATEFMTYTAFGQPANFSYWLSSLIFLGTYQAGGLALTATLTGLCVAGLYGLLWACLRQLKIGQLSAALIVLLAALMGSNNWSTRPQVLAFPLFGFCLLILIKWQAGHQRWLWWLPLITLVWVNLHGSFILVFVLMLTALVFGEGKRRWLLFVLAFSLAATLLNPAGFGLWKSTLGMIGSDLIKTYSFEWQPPINQGWQMNLFFGSLLVMAVVSAFSPARTTKMYWVLFLGFGWMALSSARYILWFTLIEAMLLAQLAKPWLERFIDKRPFFTNRVVNLVLGMIMLASTLAFLPGLRQSWWKQSPANVTDTTPVKAVEWLAQHPELPDHLWANWAANIYMTYALPQRQVWITNRIEDMTEDLLLENKKLMRASYDWPQILDKYAVRLLLLDQTVDQPLLTAVTNSSDWQEIYRDETSVIFTK